MSAWDPHSAAAGHALFSYLLELGDDVLILGHRLSEWCGHAPLLEEDLALANIALDCLGQSATLLALAAGVEGTGRDADKLAYFRDTTEFRNCLLVEQPNGDFAETIVRQLFFDLFYEPLLARLEQSRFEPLASFAAKARREVSYHLRHAKEWFLRLGDGTEESRQRTQTALHRLWPWQFELFEPSDAARMLVQQGVAADTAPLRDVWLSGLNELLAQTALTLPEEPRRASASGREGRHTEQLGRLLAEMQITARSHPEAKW